MEIIALNMEVIDREIVNIRITSRGRIIVRRNMNTDNAGKK